MEILKEKKITKIRIGDYFSSFFIRGWHLDPEQWLPVEYVDAEQFLKPERLDLVCKLFYIECREKQQKQNLARKLYTEHIRAFTEGSFTEPGAESKDSIYRYLECFENLIDDIRAHGVDAGKSVIPVGDGNSILDGSHRVAIALYYHQQIPIVRLSGVRRVYDYEFFRDRGIQTAALRYMAYLYLVYDRHSYVACLWPKAWERGKRKLCEQLLRKQSRIVYQERRRVSYRELFQWMLSLYGGQAWIGSREEGYPGLVKKVKACYLRGSSTGIYILTGRELEEMTALKQQIRELFGIGNHSIHMTDTKAEAIDAGRELLFDRKTDATGKKVQRYVPTGETGKHCSRLCADRK